MAPPFERDPSKYTAKYHSAKPLILVYSYATRVVRGKVLPRAAGWGKRGNSISISWGKRGKATVGVVQNLRNNGNRIASIIMITSGTDLASRFKTTLSFTMYLYLIASQRS